MDAVNSLVADIVFNNDAAFTELSKSELAFIINNTSICMCMQNKNMKQKAQYCRVMHAFNCFEDKLDAQSITLKTKEDNGLFNMLLIAEYKELIYESTHDFCFDGYDMLEKLHGIIQQRCSLEEQQSHIYDPEHFIFEGRKYGFYKLQKRGKNTLVY
jgi:hypothetical protein